MSAVETSPRDALRFKGTVVVTLVPTENAAAEVDEEPAADRAVLLRVEVDVLRVLARREVLDHLRVEAARRVLAEARREF